MDEVIFEKRGRIACIKLNRPNSLNAVNRAMADRLIEVWMEMRDDPEIWAGIVSGEGRAFCAGADIKEMQHGQWRIKDSLLIGERPVGPSHYDMWKPLVAAVHGHANGAGLWIAAQCDIRIASENASLGLGETRWNVPVLIAPFLSDYLPRGIVSELLYTARPINAQRAYEVGFLSRVVPEGELMPEALRVAESICECGPLAVRASKEMVVRSRCMDFESSLKIVEEAATPVWNSRDSSEAKRAFAEKRKPQWRLE